MKELETRDEFFSDADPELIERFEQSWLDDKPLEISDCLPPIGNEKYKGTLEELAHIDREFRWKNADQSTDAQLRPLESYWDTYPALREFKLGLIQGEFELAHRFTGDASIDEFVQRFGDAVDGQNLRSVLERRIQQWKMIKPVRPGSTLGRYEIVNEHGRGGFGAVWRAKDTQLGRRIAVKQLGQRLASDAESRRRFISEARVTARLEHPGIVPVYDISNVEEDHAYYTMRLIQGRTMAEAIDSLFDSGASSDEFRLKRRKLLQTFIDSCRTIEYAHAQGVIHRDIKPQNIIVGDYGETIILDWGLASVTTESEPNQESESIADDPDILTPGESVQTLRGSAVGTPAYMPPEQATGDLESIGFQSDIYSLGATLYHLVTGKVPFSDKSLANLLERVKTGELPPANKIQQSVEKPLAAIVSKAMSTESSSRYASVGEMADDVQRFLADQPVTVYRDSVWGRVSRAIRKHPTTSAVLAICTLFLVVAIATGVVLQNAWQARESQRISNLQIAAERASGTAFSQISSSRFDEAVKSLEQARDLIAGESALEELEAEISERLDRTQRLLNFYEIGNQAQEITFLDQTDNSAMLCQAALNQLGVFENPDWWTSLPDQDLSAQQKDHLSNEVYVILTLLAAMRTSETAKGTITLNMLFNAEKSTDAEKSEALQAARLAAQAASRFRSSRAMTFFEELAGFALDEIEAIGFTNINPQNLTDSAVMGSILDNNVPPGPAKTAATVYLMGDPNKVAKRWLNATLMERPEWYWIPIFIGNSLIRTKDYDSAIQSLSHAVGIRPDFWVGYQYRATANVLAAGSEKQRGKKSEYLNAASRDIQRALDLQPNNSELYWTLAMIQSYSAYDSDAIAESFLTAFELHHDISAIRGAHFTGVTQGFFNYAQTFVDGLRNEDKLTPKTSLLAVVIAMWQDDFEKAGELCQEAIEMFPDDAELKSMQQYVSKRNQDDNQEFIDFGGSSRFTWQYQFFNAELLEKRGEFEEAVFVFEKTLDLARADWQKSATRLALTRCLALNGQDKEAIDWIRECYRLNKASDFRQLHQLAIDKNWKNIQVVCEEMLDKTAPVLKYARSSSDTSGDQVIRYPALLNGDFELGLSRHWIQFTRRRKETVWNNYGKSNSSATVSQDDPAEGKQCLVLKLNSPIEPDSFGWMSQSMPVTKGKKYRVSFQYKLDAIEENGLLIGIGGKETGEFLDSIQLGKGTRDWTNKSFEFVAKDPIAKLAIKGMGTGRVWIDAIQIEIAE